MRLALPIFALPFLVAACSVAQDAHLIDLHEVSPTSVETGGMLALEGRGFPAGRVGEARLRGRFVQPGERAREVDVPFTVRAVNDARCEGELDARTVAALGGRGTFHGDLWVRFEGVDHNRVTGRMAIELDVGELGVDPERTRERRQRDHQSALGLTLDEETSDGLKVVSLTAGGIAERAGVREGDRLVALGGLRLRSAADLLLPPEDRTLVVEREGLAAELALALPRAAHRPSSFWLLLLIPLAAWVMGPGGRAIRALTPATRRPSWPRLGWMAAVSAACVALLGLRSIDVSVWLAAALALRAGSIVALRGRFVSMVREAPFVLALVGVAAALGSTETGAAWGPLEHAPIFAAPLLWGLLVAHIVGLAGPRGVIADAHRALTSTLLVALCSAGLGLGPLLALAGLAVAVLAAWLPVRVRSWGWRTALLVLPVHLAALLWMPAPTFHEGVALTAIVALVPLAMLLWPRRSVPQLHGYL